MGRFLTFTLGILVGVVLKWQYDEQQMSLGQTKSDEQPAVGKRQTATPADVQVIAIQVEPSATAPAISVESAQSPDVGH